MSLTEFGRYLSASKETIMGRWAQAVHGSVIPSAEGLSQPQLWNHLPRLLDEIALAVGGEPTPDVEEEGRDHGRQRWGSGYSIGEVVRELAILRNTLVQVAREYF